MVRNLFSHVRGNAVAYIALFIALGGTAYAALPADSVGTAQLKNGAVTGQKVAANTLKGANINESTLGTVPNAARLGGASPSAYQLRIASGCASGNAIESVGADGIPACAAFGQGTITAVNTPNGSGLSGGGTSGNLNLSIDPTVVQSRLTGTCSSSAIASVSQNGTVTCQSSEAWHQVGASGEPSFDHGWGNYPSAAIDTVAFYKDPLGVVHLKGELFGGNTGFDAFVLPVGYRPAAAQDFAVDASHAFGDLEIDSDGSVVPLNGSNNPGFSINGITFRAAG